MLQQKCLDRIEEAFVAAENHYGREFVRAPVRFSNRMTRVAGKAAYGKASCLPKELVLSNVFLTKEPEKFIGRTPGHEVAHLIVAQLYGTGHKHGPRWVEVMQVIGQEATQYHKFKRDPVKKFKYLSKCGNSKELTLIRHNKLQRGKVPAYEWKDGVQVNADDYCG